MAKFRQRKLLAAIPSFLFMVLVFSLQPNLGETSPLEEFAKHLKSQDDIGYSLWLDQPVDVEKVRSFIQTEMSVYKLKDPPHNKRADVKIDYEVRNIVIDKNVDEERVSFTLRDGHELVHVCLTHPNQSKTKYGLEDPSVVVPRKRRFPIDELDETPTSKMPRRDSLSDHLSSLSLNQPPATSTSRNPAGASSLNVDTPSLSPQTNTPNEDAMEAELSHSQPATTTRPSLDGDSPEGSIPVPSTQSTDIAAALPATPTSSNLNGSGQEMNFPVEPANLTAPLGATFSLQDLAAFLQKESETDIWNASASAWKWPVDHYAINERVTVMINDIILGMPIPVRKGCDDTRCGPTPCKATGVVFDIDENNNNNERISFQLTNGRESLLVQFTRDRHLNTPNVNAMEVGRPETTERSVEDRLYELAMLLNASQEVTLIARDFVYLSHNEFVVSKSNPVEMKMNLLEAMKNKFPDNFKEFMVTGYQSNSGARQPLMLELGLPDCSARTGVTHKPVLARIELHHLTLPKPLDIENVVTSKYNNHLTKLDIYKDSIMVFEGLRGTSLELSQVQSYTHTKGRFAVKLTATSEINKKATYNGLEERRAITAYIKTHKRRGGQLMATLRVLTEHNHQIKLPSDDNKKLLEDFQTSLFKAVRIKWSQHANHSSNVKNVFLTGDQRYSVSTTITSAQLDGNQAQLTVSSTFVSSIGDTFLVVHDMFVP
eukprot:GHVS01000418.1.p1 GENE.GHVS01000418.1~~GHVS01000418.1.p1  ORF type:complete len:722 (+),score=48.11 GHVS01000418.1:23-2167(+)